MLEVVRSQCAATFYRGLEPCAFLAVRIQSSQSHRCRLFLHRWCDCPHGVDSAPSYAML